MPRSLAACYDVLARNLDEIAGAYGRQGPSQRLARATLAKLTNRSISDIFQAGLHEFITEFIACNQQVAQAIEHDYRFYA